MGSRLFLSTAGGVQPDFFRAPEFFKSVLKSSFREVDIHRYHGMLVAEITSSAPGVGRLGIVDADTVALSNLHRQIGHACRSIGRNKAESLAGTCAEVNPAIAVTAHSLRLHERREAAALMAGGPGNWHCKICFVKLRFCLHIVQDVFTI